MELVGTLESSSPETTHELGRALGALLAAGDIVGLTGDLGAGKTHLAQGIAAGMGVGADERVVSPTFTLINEHTGRVKLAHVDLYRLSDIDEMIEIGLPDYLGGDAVCVIEWVEQGRELLPSEQIEVRLEAIGDTERRLVVSAVGRRSVQVAHSWCKGAASVAEVTTLQK